jgi:HAE1 family hydrophobic/amphiphilic exporter-1
VLGGLISSTFLSLLYIPAIFTIVDDIAGWVKRRVGGRFAARRMQTVERPEPALSE